MDPKNHRNHPRQVCKTEGCLCLEQTAVDPGDRQPPQRTKRNRSERPYAPREARKRLRRAIMKTKKLHWNKFASEAKVQDVWTATRYPKPVTETSTRPLRDEQRTIATNPEGKGLMIIQSAFLPPPPPSQSILEELAQHTQWGPRRWWHTSSDGAQTKAP